MAQGTITRKMNVVFNSLDQELSRHYTIDEFYDKIDALRRIYGENTRSRRHEVLKELYAMFDAYGVAYEPDQKPEVYEALLKDSLLKNPSFRGMSEIILDLLFNRFSTFPAPGAFLLRVVNRQETDDWKADPLRLRILKQFVKYGNYLYDIAHVRINKTTGQSVTVRDVGGKAAIVRYVRGLPAYVAAFPKAPKPKDEAVCRYLDDGVFALLEDATAEDKKISGKYGLLKIADDLASGKIRSEGSTKKCLYYFAIVYGLTYTTCDGNPEEMSEEAIRSLAETDIETALFRDYYANSMLTFLSREWVNGGNAYQELALDPSGEGINYKNFAEMIMLYYIHRSDLTPVEKLQRSNDMILRVKKACHGRPAPEKGDDTLFLRGAFTDDILSKDEADFEAYICENYDCNTGGTLGAFQLRTSRNTAFACYKTICSALKTGKTYLDAIYSIQDQALNDQIPDRRIEDLGPVPVLPTDVILKNASAADIKVLNDCDYGLWLWPALKKSTPEKDPARARFMEMVKNLNNFFLPPEKSKTNGMNSIAESADKITRAKLIAAYYYLFNVRYELEEPDAAIRPAHRTFNEIYKAFADGVNPYLETAGYQPLSGKNLFDVFTAFSVYAYQYD